MKIKNLIIVIFTICFASEVLAAGGGGGGSEDESLKTATKFVESGKKLEKKGKIEKAKKRYEKAFEYLLKANKKDSSNPDVLNYMGFTSRKLGDFTNAERYYQMGLDIDPKHVGINEYMGELYLSTNRPELAKERLAVLKDCNCEEYDELKALIEGKKESKY